MTDDLLWRNLKSLPAFRGLLRAVEGKYYDGLSLPEPTLDLGCGDGHFAAETFRRPLAAGIDPWWLPLKEARGRRAYAVVAQADGRRLPFPTGYFASAISNSVLEHIPDVEPVLADVHRVLQPGALFVFCSPSQYFLEFLSVSSALRLARLGGLAKIYERFFNRISRHHHCDSPEVWRQRLARAGFAVERHWYYFSRGALRALELGHYFGLPSAVAKVLTGRWILAPNRVNLWLTDRLLRRYFEEKEQAAGAYLFVLARKKEP